VSLDCYQQHRPMGPSIWCVTRLLSTA